MTAFLYSFTTAHESEFNLQVITTAVKIQLCRLSFGLFGYFFHIVITLRRESSRRCWRFSRTVWWTVTSLCRWYPDDLIGFTGSSRARVVMQMLSEPEQQRRHQQITFCFLHSSQQHAGQAALHGIMKHSELCFMLTRNFYKFRINLPEFLTWHILLKKSTSLGNIKNITLNDFYNRNVKPTRLPLCPALHHAVIYSVLGNCSFHSRSVDFQMLIQGQNPAAAWSSLVQMSLYPALRGDPQAFPGQSRHIISVCSGSTPQPAAGRICLENLGKGKEAPRHPDQKPKPPELTPCGGAVAPL